MKLEMEEVSASWSTCLSKAMSRVYSSEMDTFGERDDEDEEDD